MDIAEIGRKVKDARRHQRLAQRQLGDKTGVSRATIAALERGRAGEIGYAKLTRILAAVGLELRLEPARSERPTLEDLLKEDAEDDPRLDR